MTRYVICTREYVRDIYTDNNNNTWTVRWRAAVMGPGIMLCCMGTYYYTGMDWSVSYYMG